MPEIKDVFKFVANEIQSADNMERVKLDTQRYQIYNGQLRKIIKEAALQEFLLPETVNDFSNRIVPLNLMQKLIDKLSSVYQEEPIREPISGDETDQESLEFFVDKMCFNEVMKNANKYFRLHKHTLLEPFLDAKGIPQTRVLPSQTYTPFSFDPIEPNEPTMIVKHIKIDFNDAKNTRLQVWTDEEFKIVDGEGTIIQQEMEMLGNPDGVNPFGVLPFTYINSSPDLLLPISDDDVLALSKIIPILLTDMTFASKYQAWSLIAVIGADDESLSFNPNSVIHLPIGPNGERPSIETIKPQLDIPEMLSFIESLVGMLLTTKNLSVGTVTGKLTVGNASSGIAKMIDRSESTEDRQDQISIFEKAEKQYWDKFAHMILPTWRESGNMDPECVRTFQDDFELSIKFPEIKPAMGDKEKLELLLLKLNNNLTTKRRVLEQINSTMNSDQIDDLMQEIEEENREAMELFNGNIQDEGQEA